MKTSELFKRYFWLIDLINQTGGISRDEINQRWRRSVLNELSEKEIPERTFHRHKEAIKELFDIDIICDRSPERIYRIEYTDAEKSETVRSWLLNTFSLSNILMESRDIHERILVENVPSGQKFLSGIVKALRENSILNICYQNFHNGKPWSFDIEPYCVKLFRQRWYLVARSPYDDKIRIYGLDRILEMSETGGHFKLSQKFNASAFFENSFGIITADDDKPETIEFKVTNNQRQYIRSLPLHHSQREIRCEPDYSVFTIFVNPTFDLMQEFLKYGDSLELIRPDGLRKQLAEIIKRIHSHYFGDEYETLEKKK